MHANDDDRMLAASRAGRTAPTPLFLGFLGALVLCGLAAFSDGVSLTAAAEFLVLAAVISATVMAAFSVAVIWSTRARQRASELAMHRPGALVVPAVRTRALARAARTLGDEALIVPLGLTVVADGAGFELWYGSAEHPTRLGRAPWESVEELRVTPLTRWGRATRGITVTIATLDGTRTALDVAFIGAGLGGLFAPTPDALDQLRDALDGRRELARAHS